MCVFFATDPNLSLLQWREACQAAGEGSTANISSSDTQTLTEGPKFGGKNFPPQKFSLAAPSFAVLWSEIQMDSVSTALGSGREVKKVPGLWLGKEWRWNSRAGEWGKTGGGGEGGMLSKRVGKGLEAKSRTSDIWINIKCQTGRRPFGKERVCSFSFIFNSPAWHACLL